MDDIGAFIGRPMPRSSLINFRSVVTGRYNERVSHSNAKKVGQRRIGSKLMLNVMQIVTGGGTKISFGKMNVFIGPNNGGKSQTLREMVDRIAFRNDQGKAIVRIEIGYEPDPETLLRRLVQECARDSSGGLILDTAVPDFSRAEQIRPGDGLLNGVEGNLEVAIDRLRYFGRHFVAHLTTERRLLLVNRQVNRQDGVEGYQSVLEAAFEAKSARTTWLADHVRRAFDVPIMLDDTHFASIEYRIADPDVLPAEKSELRLALQNKNKLSDQGDGLRSFVGTLAAASMTDRPLVFIDEPEAFLHPPQAFELGRALGELNDLDHQIFIATHSSDILRGILASSKTPTIVRCDEVGGNYRHTLLEPALLERIASDPVLSSSRTLEGLFYRTVVIVESEGDEILYRNVLGRIDRKSSIHFVNCYAKVGAGDLAAPFRSMGIPVAIVLDFDILRVPDEFRKLFVTVGGEWHRIGSQYGEFVKLVEESEPVESRLGRVLESLATISVELDKTRHPSEQLEWIRRKMTEIREKASIWSILKKNGTRALNARAVEVFVKIDRLCRRHGLFIASLGEREAWLSPEVPYSKNKRRWTELAMKYLSDTPLPRIHPLSRFARGVAKYIGV